MSASVLAFPSRGKGPQPWTNDELAELYRVVDLLGRAGLAVATDMGMSDEGDPWFVFCRTDNEEVIAHFARIDGVFVAASIAVDETFRGANFRQIVDRMVSSQPLVMPRPTSGSKLFLHPAVMLTAFVATALAHSEKTQVLDWLHAVEAQWGHSKAALLSEVKHIKTGWLDTLQTLWKLPLHEDKLAHDGGKEGMLSLASLIAIALAALQPIAEKMSAISQFVADELPGHSANASQASAAHAAQMAQDGSADGAAGPADDHAGGGGRGGNHGGGGDDTATGNHKAASAASADADNHQATIDHQAAADAAHAAAVSAVQKTAFADDTAHAAAPAAETPADSNGVFLLMQQKAAAMTQSSSSSTAEAFSIHVDLSANTAQPISIQDVTSEALQLLNIHVTKTDLAATKTSTTADGTGGSSDPVLGSSPLATTTPTDTSSSTVVQAQPTNQTVDVVHVSGEAVIQAISNFVTSEAHNISTPISLSSGLQQQLASYFGANSSLKVIFFESDNPMADVFAFSSDVVFVNEKDVSPSAHMNNGGGNLILDVTGGTVTLVGVTTIEHSAAV